MISRDVLWKGIIEDLIDDMFRFFFPQSVQLINFDRGFEFLDKELEQLIPASESRLRHADKLIKAWLQTGAEHWFLFHVEVQDYADPDFSKRMFQSAYRIQDRYERPVTVLAIYTDRRREFHVDEYHYSFLGTEIIYRFNTFSIIDHTPEVLISNNIFSIVLETARIALQRPMKDEALMRDKLALVRKLVEKGYGLDKVRKISNFIRYYVRFAKQENSLKFEEELDLVYQNRKSMGIEEAILEEAKQQGLKQGIKKGLAKGRQEGRQEGMEGGIQFAKRTIIANGIQKGLSEDLLATLTELTIEEVRTIIESLKKDK